MLSQFEVEIGNEDILDVYNTSLSRTFRERRSWSDRALKDVHEVSDFFKFHFLFIYSVFFCASYSPFAQVSCICPPGWNTREITPVMQGNPELKGMNELIIWKTIGSETRTNRAQKVASLEVLPTFLAITRTAKFFCTICSRRLSPREMRMYISTRWSLALHSKGSLSGIFLIAKTSLITISDVPLSIRKLA